MVCVYRNELPEDLLEKVVNVGSVVIGNNGLYCERGQTVGTAYFLKNCPRLTHVYIYTK